MFKVENLFGTLTMAGSGRYCRKCQRAVGNEGCQHVPPKK